MRKKILAIGLATLTMLAFTGCNKSTSHENTTEATKETTTEVTTEATTEATTEVTTEVTTEATTDASDNAEKQTADLNGSLQDILAVVYANADLDPGLREAMQYYMTEPINEDSEEYILGTTELEYEEAICSAPMMSSVAYQCVLVRMPEGADIEAAKKLLVDSADPRKWICVEAEAVVAENVDNLILMIMTNQETVDAVTASFLGLAE